MILSVFSDALPRLLTRAFAPGGILLFSLLLADSQAQITLDGTLGPKGPLAGPDYTINAEAGQLRGSNLFHSFGQFNVHRGESATFTGPATVKNVIGRVTGGQQSIIDGTLRSEMPKADLYLLNPSGVLFGANASLEVPGSFHVSTADYLKLGDDGRFDATQPSNSVLTSAPPSAFGFLGGNPTPISIQGSSLQVPKGKTLSVIGGDITVTGKEIPPEGKEPTTPNLHAPGGKVQIASVASLGEVVPSAPGQAPDLTVSGFARLGGIEVSQGGLISASGESGGTVIIRGGRLEVDNATISSATLGDVNGARTAVDIQATGEVVVANQGFITADVEGSGDGGDIRIKASSVEASNKADIRSSVSPSTPPSTGNSGNIELQVGRLTVTGGALIRSRTDGEGQGGDVTITATDAVTITGYVVEQERTRESRVVSVTQGAGKAGTVTISAPTLVVADSGSISASAFKGSTGNGGNIEVKAGQLRITSGAQISSDAEGDGLGGRVVITATDSITIGGRGGPQQSGVSASTTGKGDAGMVKVSAPTLVIEKGGVISAGAKKESTGKGGDIVVDVGRLTLTGGTISAVAEKNTTDDGGDIDVRGKQLMLSDGAQITSSTQGAGHGGTVIVIATDAITITGRDKNKPSGLVNETTGAGNAGTVTVSVPTLVIEKGGEISADATKNSAGKGGDVAVNVERLTLTSGGRIRSETFGAGHGGTVDITATDSITITGQCCDGDRSGLLTIARGPNQGGDIIVHARHITLDDGTISANSHGKGDAGTLHIHATETFRSRNDGKVTTSAAQAGGGKINLTAGQTVELVNSGITTEVRGGTGNAGNITIGSERMGSKRASTAGGGASDVSDITIDPRFVVLNDSRVSAQAQEGRGGNIRIGADVFLQSPNSVVDASSKNEDLNGVVDIRGLVSNLSGSLAPLPQGYLRTEMLVEDRCARRLQEGQVSSFVVAGRDGIPLQPGGILPSPLVDAAPASATAPPEEHMAKGQKAFHQGAFEQAVLYWREAARLYESAAKPDKQGEALRQLAQASQALGQYQETFSSLTLALALAKQSGEQTLIASVLHGLGTAYTATGPLENASRSFNESLGIAKQLQNPELSAAILNDLGNLFTTQKKYAEALAAYQESATLAKIASHQVLAISAQINAATAALRNGQYQESRVLLDQAAVQARHLEPSHDAAYDLITVGLTYRTLRSHLPNAAGALLQHAFTTLTEAARVAETLNDQRAVSYAWGYLGALYEDERRYQDALQLTRRATFAAQQANAPESLYRWQWQTGRLLTALGQKEAAVAAYRGAVASLRTIRHGMSVGYGSGQTSFRESVGAVYFELVDLLLQRAAALPQREQSTPYLSEARETVELLRAAELRDYFRDDCVNTARSRVTRLDDVSRTAVVVYPIILPDRTELLISLPGGLQRIAAPVSAETLTQEVRRLRHTLEKRTTREYLLHAQRLYNWLIRPLEPALAAAAVDTLVFVPDGPLRTIPMAALHDGTQFLISKYAVATTLGLDLTDPRPLKREGTKMLAAGLTQAVRGFPALPYVSTELQAIQRLYGGAPLLNERFLAAAMEQESKTHPLSIMHIASHGYFAGEVENSFLVTFDDKLTMDRLSQVVGLFRFRETPLELLTLSACETAAGDDRAALGLAGVAIKAGARSALATLWSVNDEASAVLVTAFYQQLHDTSVSRAVALQWAQRQLLADRRYQHPAYWSPFLLLNNWL